MKKVLPILIIILIALGLVWYFTNYNSQPEVVDNVNQNTNTSQDEVDTSEWVTFTDEELGISYKHPEGCSWNGAGPGTSVTNGIGCGDSAVFYEPIGYSHNSGMFNNFNNMSIKEIAQNTYIFNKDKYGNKQTMSNSIDKIDIGAYESYQFFVDKFFSIPCEEDIYGGVCGSGGILGIKKNIVFVSNKVGDKVLILQIPYDDPVSEAILSTLIFLE